MPPSFKAGKTSAKIRCCRRLQSITASSLHSSKAAGSFLNSPLPLQGASTNIKSKNPGNCLKWVGSLLVTTVLGEPHLTRFSTNMPALDLITSLATSKAS